MTLLDLLSTYFPVYPFSTALACQSQRSQEPPNPGGNHPTRTLSIPASGLSPLAGTRYTNAVPIPYHHSIVNAQHIPYHALSPHLTELRECTTRTTGHIGTTSQNC